VPNCPPDSKAVLRLRTRSPPRLRYNAQQTKHSPQLFRNYTDGGLKRPPAESGTFHGLIELIYDVQFQGRAIFRPHNLGPTVSTNDGDAARWSMKAPTTKIHLPSKEPNGAEGRLIAPNNIFACEQPSPLPFKAHVKNHKRVDGGEFRGRDFVRQGPQNGSCRNCEPWLNRVGRPNSTFGS